MKRALLTIGILAALGGLFAAGVLAQQTRQVPAAGLTRSSVEQALQDRDNARKRAEELEAAAERASEAAERTARQSAALAARIQQSEAAIALAEARLAIIDRQQRALAARLAVRQQPVVRLTAALQRFSRRPLALSVMRPGSVREMVYMRALLASTLPEVQQRTAALRGELKRAADLQGAAIQTVAALRGSESELERRRTELAELEARQRLVSREATGAANQEAERAVALAEEARDLDALLERLDEAGSLREQLAMLPGPIVRPPRPAASEVVAVQERVTSGEVPAPPGYQLPVAGRTLAGFGSAGEAGVPSKGVTMAPRNGAQVVAPGPGRVVFAGPYRGYGRIVIIEHDGGWTSLVTGLARIDVAVGAELLGGAPIGIAPQRNPSITLELRRSGEAVNPLDFLG